MLDFFIGLVKMSAAAFVYMLPAAIAWKRNVKNNQALGWFNLLLGWTVIVWIICFCLAFADPKPKDS